MKKRMKKLTAVLCAASLTLSGSAAAAASTHVNLTASLGTYGKLVAALAMNQEASWLKNVSLDMVMTHGDTEALRLDALLNDVKLASVYSYISEEDLVLYLDGISSTYLTASVPALLEMLEEASENAASGNSSDGSEIYNLYLDDVFQIFYEYIDQTEETTRTVQVEDIVNETTNVHFTINMGQGAQMLHDFSEIVLENEDLLEEMASNGEISVEEAREMYEQLASDEFLNSVENKEAQLFEGDYCTNADGEFVALYGDGRFEDQSFNVNFEIPRDDEKTALKLNMGIANTMNLDASMRFNQEGAFAWNIDLDSEELSLDMNVDFNHDGGEFALSMNGRSAISGNAVFHSDENIHSGEITLLAGEIINEEIGVSDLSLVIDYEGDTNTQTYKGTGTLYTESNDIITLDFTADQEANDLEIPGDLKQLQPVLDMTSETFGQDFAATLNFADIINHLAEAGLPLNNLFAGSEN